MSKSKGIECHTFTTFAFDGRCVTCGKLEQAHEVNDRFYCKNCCPACRPVKREEPDANN